MNYTYSRDAAAECSAESSSVIELSATSSAKPYRCRTLAQRIKDGILDDAPIYCGSVRDFIDGGYAALYRGLVDCLCAGFPCPPFSLAGKRLGDRDSRNAWPETRDAIAVIKPRFAFLENVPGLVTSPYLKTIRGNLQELGYRLRATVLGGIDVGAPHIRKRLWLLAYPDNMGTRRTHTAKRSFHAIPPLSACVQNRKIYPSPMPSDVHGGRTTKGSKRPNEGGLRKAVFPTPQCRDAQTMAKCKRGENSPGGTPLPVAVGGTLNPDWVEWLMGWPIGWTDLRGDGQIPRVAQIAWETLT